MVADWLPAVALGIEGAAGRWSMVEVAARAGRVDVGGVLIEVASGDRRRGDRCAGGSGRQSARILRWPMEPVDLDSAISELTETFPLLPRDYVWWLATGAEGRRREFSCRNVTLEAVLASAFQVEKFAIYGIFGPESGVLRIGAVLIGGDMLLRFHDGAILYYDHYLSESGGDQLPDLDDAVVLYRSFTDFMKNTAVVV